MAPGGGTILLSPKKTSNPASNFTSCEHPYTQTSLFHRSWTRSSVPLNDKLTSIDNTSTDNQGTRTNEILHRGTGKFSKYHPGN